MDRQKELELLEKIKVFFNDDNGMTQAAKFFHERVDDDFKFKLQSATWDAIGEIPDSIGGNKPELHTKAPQREVAALFFAAQMRCMENRCPHVTPVRSIALRAILSLRVLTCNECTLTFIERFGNTPTRTDECDLCLRQGVTTFHQFAVAWQGVVLTGDICPDCSVLLESQPR